MSSSFTIKLTQRQYGVEVEATGNGDVSDTVQAFLEAVSLVSETPGYNPKKEASDTQKAIAARKARAKRA